MSLTTALFIAFFVGMVLMHMRGHGHGHGHGHGGMGCGGHRHGDKDRATKGDDSPLGPSPHRHG